MRNRRGLFERYPKDEPLHLIGIINCAGCPTIVAPEKILRRVRALAEYRLDALHFSFCMTALCPFINKYEQIIKEKYPGFEIIQGTHKPLDKKEFRRGVKELLCHTILQPQTMNDMIKGTLRLPDGPLAF
jgi:predicted metal-binding protein